MSDDEEEPDPERILSILAPFRADGSWHLRARFDIRQNILDRRKQKAFLARYGKQDMWATRGSIVELNRNVVALSEVVEKENELTRKQEDM